ncbi:MAG TPA: hypothetical protein VF624_02810 [Tepidisphaeraceae bacterium]|jgi:hypothetical protein
MFARFLSTGLALLCFAGTVGAQDHAAGKAPAKTSDVYSRPVDALTGEPLGDKPVIVQHEGRELRFATQANADAFKADAAGNLKKLDALMVAEQTPNYPLKTCVVSGEELGSMGKPVDVIHNNRLVRLCCAGCKGALTKDPKAAFEKLNAAVVSAQKPTYAAKQCVVMAHDGLTEGSTDYVVANRLVRFCCDGCVEEFEKQPAKYLAKLDVAGNGAAKK